MIVKEQLVEFINRTLGATLTHETDMGVLVAAIVELQERIHTLIEKFPELRDIDLVDDQFLDYLFDEFGVALPRIGVLNRREILRESKNWYMRKGTPVLYKYLAAALGLPISIFEPATLLIRPSDPSTLLSGAMNKPPDAPSRLGRLRDGIYWAYFTYHIKLSGVQYIEDLTELYQAFALIHPAGTRAFYEFIDTNLIEIAEQTAERIFNIHVESTYYIPMIYDLLSEMNMTLIAAFSLSGSSLLNVGTIKELKYLNNLTLSGASTLAATLAQTTPYNVTGAFAGSSALSVIIKLLTYLQGLALTGTSTLTVTPKKSDLADYFLPSVGGFLFDIADGLTFTDSALTLPVKPFATNAAFLKSQVNNWSLSATGMLKGHNIMSGIDRINDDFLVNNSQWTFNGRWTPNWTAPGYAHTTASGSASDLTYASGVWTAAANTGYYIYCTQFDHIRQSLIPKLGASVAAEARLHKPHAFLSNVTAGSVFTVTAGTDFIGKLDKIRVQEITSIRYGYLYSTTPALSFPTGSTYVYGTSDFTFIAALRVDGITGTEALTIGGNSTAAAADAWTIKARANGQISLDSGASTTLVNYTSMTGLYESKDDIIVTARREGTRLQLFFNGIMLFETHDKGGVNYSKTLPVLLDRAGTTGRIPRIYTYMAVHKVLTDVELKAARDTIRLTHFTGYDIRIVDKGASVYPYNLTTIGSADWIKVGNTGLLTDTRKLGTQTITAMPTSIADGYFRGSSTTAEFTWTNGDNQMNNPANYSETAIFYEKVGYIFSIAMSPVQWQRLHVWWWLDDCTLQMIVGVKNTLDVPFTDEKYIEHAVGTGTGSKYVQIDFKGRSGQTLDVFPYFVDDTDTFSESYAYIKAVALENVKLLKETIMADTPQGFWMLDETSGTVATDSSGNNRHGTYTGTYTLNASPIVFETGGCLDLNGAGHVDIANYPQIGNTFAMECWHTAKDVAAVYGLIIRARSDVSSITSPAISLRHSNATGTYKMRTQIPSPASGTAVDLLYDTEARLGTVYHVLYQQSAAGGELWINGRRVATTTAQPTPAVQVTSLFLGTNLSVQTPATKLKGKLSMVAVYDHIITQANIEKRVRRGFGHY